VSNIINVAGDFNGFSKDSVEWEMGQTSLGVWSVTSPHPINPGVSNMKFVTDQNFDVPPDWGGDESVTIPVPATNAATRKVTGSGTAIKLDFTAGGTYTFTLDERRQVFSIQPGPGPGRVAVTRSRRR
jgi:hypothetical protein